MIVPTAWPAPDAPRLGIGCMRLSTAPDRDEARAIDVLHAAFDAGVTFLDTADAYCHDESEVGHNERVIARALARWSGDRSRIVVATKGGLTRPHGRWVADGRARHLAAACEASCRALDVARIALYQLHAIDPRTRLSTSIRALDGLRRNGLIDAIGLCNVTVGQIEEARRIVEVAAVQVELSAWQDANLLNGVAAYCLANGIRLIAYRPLGGVRRRHRTLSDPVLGAIADRHRVTPFEVALAWLTDLSPLVVPIPGPTQVATARSAARARSVELTDEDRARLDERLPAVRLLRRGVDRSPGRARPQDTGREVVLIMGLPGAGKSSLAESYVARGHTRLNRDLTGGALRGLASALESALAAGSTAIVLDNTYVSRQSRAPIVHAAARHDIPVRCIWLATSVEEAQVNAAWRMVSRYGRLLTPEEIPAAARQDPGVYGPTTPFRYQRALEPPDPSEGFAHVDIVSFERRRDPSFVNRAVVLWCDGVLWHSRAGRRAPASPDDVVVTPEHGSRLREYQEKGWRVLGLSWQPGIEDGTCAQADVEEALARMRAVLRLDIEVAYCPHGAGPPRCWCRKPLPGLGVAFILRHALDPAACLYVGKGAQDPGFARRLGFEYRDADEFFGAPVQSR